MIYLNKDGMILVNAKSEYFIDFETLELEHCRFRLKITSNAWLEKHNYEFIGSL